MKIIKQISNDYTVDTGNKYIVCKARGKFRKLGITPLVGDNVLINEEEKYILDILPRKNSLIRPTIANVDQAIIVTSVKVPDFSTNLLDKLLMIIEYNNIVPIIYISKLDLLNEEELENINYYIKYYKKIGYQVFTNDNIDDLKKVFKDKITVLTGQSGAGKSTLLNKLDPNLNIKIGDVSIALGRGKHTTRHVELINLLDGLIADTPGFSSLSLDEIPDIGIKDNFIEFNNYRHNCQYKDCMHINEQDCEVKRQVENKNIIQSRYENYIKFIKEKRLWSYLLLFFLWIN